MTSMIEPRCSVRQCKHFRVESPPDDDEAFVCAAYPNGIPEEIAYGDDLHLIPRSDQNNEIVYEREDE